MIAFLHSKDGLRDENDVRPFLKGKGRIRTMQERATDLTHPALKQQLLHHAEEVGGLIFECLALPRNAAFGFNSVWNLCCEHGCEPLVLPELPRYSGGLYLDWRHENTEFSDGGYIALSAHMTFAESCAVMIHELAHRLLYTPRFADWLDKEREYRCYDEREWQEAVARAVERRFLEAGGTGLLPPRY